MDVRRVSGTVSNTVFADPHIDYMHFLEECRKAEDEDKVDQTKPRPPKAKVAAATVPPTREDELAKTAQITAAPDRFLGGPGQEN